jgi:hypothetical protein
MSGDFPLLTQLAPRLPDSTDLAARTRMREVLTELSAGDRQRLASEYDAACEPLDSPAFAQFCAEAPWRGPGQPFAAQRFRLAMERTVAAGAQRYDYVRANPSALGQVSTEHAMADDALVCPVLAMPTQVLIRDVNDELAGGPGRWNIAIGGLTDSWNGIVPNEWDELGDTTLDDHDPQLPAFRLVVDVKVKKLSSLAEAPADPRLAASGARAGLLHGAKLPPAVYAMIAALAEAAAACWVQLGRPVATGEFNTALNTTLGTKWSRLTWGDYDATELAGLPVEQLRAAAVALVATAVYWAVPDALKPQATALVDQYRAAVPGDGQRQLTDPTSP